MTTPAIFPAAMISLVALAATHERRDRAAAVWLGMAVALSGWALLPGIVVLAASGVRKALSTTLALVAIALGAATAVLGMAAVPHSLGVGIAPAIGLALFGALGLTASRLRLPRPLRAQRIG